MSIPQTEVTAFLDGREIYRNVLPPGDYSIGRESDSLIQLPSDKVSRRHGQLTLNYFDWVIEDFGSSNGTRVSGRPVREATLIFPRQEVHVGNVQLHIHRLQSPESEEPSDPQTAAVLRYLPPEMRGDQKYRIHGLLGMGGMGAVLEAEDVAARRRVAMKVMLNARSEEDVARFVEEAQVTAQLEHPHIMPIYELGVNELNRPYYVMKLVRGESLGKVLTDLQMQRISTVERYALADLLAIFDRICEAIGYAHSKGVVHRDLKPDNVLLGPFSETIVMDWGLSKPLGHSAHSGVNAKSIRTMVNSARREDPGLGTIAGLAIGTPQYMAPEQASGDQHTVDARTDVYGLGALLYSILTLRPPIAPGNPIETLTRVVGGKITPPAEMLQKQPAPHLPGGKLPGDLAKVAMKALSLEPGNRYDSARSLQIALQSARQV